MTIILATDGSVFARIGEALLGKIPTLRQSEVIVASVASSPHILSTGFEPLGASVHAEMFAELYEQSRRHAHTVVDETCARMRDLGIPARPRVLEGDAASELLRLSDELGADLIIVGSRGMGAWAGLLLGSVARKTVVHSKCPVLVGRCFRNASPEETLARLATKPKLSVLVGVDGSHGSEAALQFLESAGAKAFAEITVVCAEPLTVLPPGYDPAGAPEIYAFDHDLAVEATDQASQRLNASADSVSTWTEVGKPVTVLTETAERKDADLILLGAKGHGVLERFLIGSVSYEIATTAPCSVMVARPGSNG